MKKVLASLIGLLLIPAAAMALSQSSIPPKFFIPWGNQAGSAYIRSIPVPSQIGILNCAASLTDGFPPLTFTPSIAGGCPPDGRDFNGILKQITQWAQWQSAGGPVYYDSAFAASVGGYPKGSIVMSAVVLGDHWMSTADNNQTDPDAGGAGWVQAPGETLIGTPVQSLYATVPTGYVYSNGLTIGNASSNATNRADADTKFLFAFVWLHCDSTACPIYTSTGTASTRGVSADADYAANKAIAVPNLSGAALMGADSQGNTSTNFLANVPVTSGSRAIPGSILGENLHSLTGAENGQHNHTLTDPGHTHTYQNLNSLAALSQTIPGSNSFQTGGTGNAVRLLDNTAASIQILSTSTGITIASSGSGTAHNTVPRSAIVYWNLKL